MAGAPSLTVAVVTYAPDLRLLARTLAFLAESAHHARGAGRLERLRQRHPAAFPIRGVAGAPRMYALRSVARDDPARRGPPRPTPLVRGAKRAMEQGCTRPPPIDARSSRARQGPASEYRGVHEYRGAPEYGLGVVFCSRPPHGLPCGPHSRWLRLSHCPDAARRKAAALRLAPVLSTDNPSGWCVAGARRMVACARSSRCAPGSGSSRSASAPLRRRF
mgnify:CR=1 FL=1